MNAIQALYIKKDATLKDALKQLDDTAQGLLFLVDSNDAFIQTITDGDIRRVLLKDCPLDTLLDILPTHKSATLPDTSSVQDAYSLMQEYEIDHIPLLDAKGKPKQLIQRKDLSSNILLSTPHMGDHERKYVQEAFDSNWVAPLGPNVDAFENEVAAYLGVKAAVALSSGTAAIHLALVLLDVKPGDWVFCSSFTFVASANPILYLGAKPVFIDSDLDTWNMSPVALERALKEAKELDQLPKAVVIVNIYGQSANYERLSELCNQYNVPIVEDAAESLGAKYNGKYSGTFGKFGVFSFNGNKIITTSGGGMLVSNDEELIEKARFLSTQARDPAPYYEHSVVGYNYRMSNVLAGIGRGQLHVLQKRVESRRAIYNQYKRGFKDVPYIAMMPEIKNGYSTHWLSAILIKYDEYELRSIDSIIEKLKENQIEVRRTWKPMHQQKLFTQCPYFRHGRSDSVSDYLFNNAICLPSGSNLTPLDIDRVIYLLLDLMMVLN